MFKNKKYIPAFWFSSNNFGDALTHELIRTLSGKYPVLYDQEAEGDKVMVTGSIINIPVKDAIVWGCGLSHNIDIPHKKEIRAVRGPLTARAVRLNGQSCPDIFGDPALLLPYIYPKITIHPNYKLGIIPHYVDLPIVLDLFKESKDVLIIDINAQIHDVLNDIWNCDKIISSSLHGIITSHAYGIPCEWIKFSNLIHGDDDIKFKDYYESIGISDKSFLDIRDSSDAIDFYYDIFRYVNSLNEKLLPNELPDLKKLLEVCPFYETGIIDFGK